MDGLQTFVLNQGGVLVHTTSWRRGIILTLTNKARVLENHAIKVYENLAKGIVYYAPRVVQLIDIGFPIKDGAKRALPFTKKNIYDRDNGKCQYCSKKLSLKNMTIDHVTPISKGGKNRWENIVVACRKCNNLKGDKTPEEASLKLLRKPFVPTLQYRWSKPRGGFVQGEDGNFTYQLA